MDTRPHKNETFIDMAVILSKQSTCRRRQAGCILVDKYDHIISSGYNGVAAGLRHCLLYPCGGHAQKTGEGLELCEAIHAEQNALMQCSDVNKIVSAYVTTEPCIHCTKMLMNTSCKKIYFNSKYANSGEHLWVNAGRLWIRL